MYPQCITGVLGEVGVRCLARCFRENAVSKGATHVFYKNNPPVGKCPLYSIACPLPSNSGIIDHTGGQLRCDFLLAFVLNVCMLWCNVVIVDKKQNHHKHNIIVLSINHNGRQGTTSQLSPSENIWQNLIPVAYLALRGH